MAARRRHPAAIAILLLLGLVAVGGAYSLLAPKQAQASVVSADDVSAGKSLFLANCATCHGLNAEGSAAGPTLVGVGAAAVDFQVGTGRMPLAAPSVQAQRQDTSQFSPEQIQNMAAWVASLAPGPAIPSAEEASGQNGNAALGGEIFRINCAQCHNYAGSGGALSRGKYAPALTGSSGKTIIEAMLTGPQSMPVFSNNNISAENKSNIIAYLKTTQAEQQVGGMTLGNLGPVSEGMFIWIFGLGLMLGCAVWLGQKAA